MTTREPESTEPVPAATQIIVLPFLAALEGYIQGVRKDPDFRATVHRTMVRGNQQYLQQVTSYVGTQHTGVGRTFHTNTGIIGATYHKAKIYRTKPYSEESALLADIALDQRENGESVSSKIPRSYMSVPFIGVSGRPILVLYVDSTVFNRFADDVLVRGVVSMCQGFARFITTLQRSPIGQIKNFPLVEARDAVGTPTIYKRVQEGLDWEVPSIAPIASFNFESSAA
jgi:hypothetical protein